MGFGRGGTGVLRLDGKDVAKATMPNPVTLSMTVDETFDIGVDTRTGVDDADYLAPFQFDGQILNLTVQLKGR